MRLCRDFARNQLGVDGIWSQNCVENIVAYFEVERSILAVFCIKNVFYRSNWSVLVFAYNWILATLQMDACYWMNSVKVQYIFKFFFELRIKIWLEIYYGLFLEYFWKYLSNTAYN